jgi:hypothetical protein
VQTVPWQRDSLVMTTQPDEPPAETPRPEKEEEPADGEPAEES